MSASLVGSEMCIRDRFTARGRPRSEIGNGAQDVAGLLGRPMGDWPMPGCLLYTSDAADDM
eukprot:1763421-Alexandrium_andersonii.AAC.1